VTVTKQFVTASTYKLFVAYSVLKRIDGGTRELGHRVPHCFNKMISQSDNACAESFQTSLGGLALLAKVRAQSPKISTRSG
jgi:beta-lactamase class A